MALTTFDLEDLYGEISDLARDQGIRSKEQWDELVDEVIEDHLDLGELDMDQDTEGMKVVLQDRWSIYREESMTTDEAEKIEEDMEIKGEREEGQEEDELEGFGIKEEEDVI